MWQHDRLVRCELSCNLKSTRLLMRLPLWTGPGKAAQREGGAAQGAREYTQAA